MAAISFLPLCLIHVFKGKNKVSEIQLCGKRDVNRDKGGQDYTCLRNLFLLKFNFVEKWGLTGKKGGSIRRACDSIGRPNSTAQ